MTDMTSFKTGFTSTCAFIKRQVSNSVYVITEPQNALAWKRP